MSRKYLTAEQAATIINGVTEDFVDQGDTSFATKKQLCEAILWLAHKRDMAHARASSRRDKKMIEELRKAGEAMSAFAKALAIPPPSDTTT